MSETNVVQRRVRLNGRVVGIIVALLLLIAAAVVVTDRISVRDRNPAAAMSQPTTQP